MNQLKHQEQNHIYIFIYSRKFQVTINEQKK